MPTCHSPHVTAPAYRLQELCEGNLEHFLSGAPQVLYAVETGAVMMSALAPLLLDICKGMLYLHSRNIVHGGRL